MKGCPATRIEALGRTKSDDSLLPLAEIGYSKCVLLTQSRHTANNRTSNSAASKTLRKRRKQHRIQSSKSGFRATMDPRPRWQSYESTENR